MGKINLDNSDYPNGFRAGAKDHNLPHVVIPRNGFRKIEREFWLAQLIVHTPRYAPGTTVKSDM